MEHSRTVNSTFNLLSGVISKFVSLIMNFILRTVFIYTLGENFLGLNGLFTTVLSTLSLAELGVGSAIIFFLYKPIAENDKEKIKSLMHFYRRVYIYIGLIIGILGLTIVPILKYLVNVDTELPVNIYYIYFLYLGNSILSYLFFSYMQSILNATQKTYIVNAVNSIFTIFNTAILIVVLLSSRNYMVFLVTKIFLGIVCSYTIRQLAFKECPYLKERNIKPIDAAEKKLIFKNVKDIFVFRLTGIIAHSIDNIVISVVLGTVMVGYNSNYDLIINNVGQMVSLVIYSVVASVGNLAINENIEKRVCVFREINLANYIISTIAFCGTACLSNDFIRIWLKNDIFILPFLAVWLRCLFMYMDTVLDVCYIFRDAMGLFRYGRYINLFSALFNLVLTVLWSKLMGITGVFLASVVSSLFTSWIYFPKIIFKYGFSMKYKKEILQLVFRTGFACVLTVIIYFVTEPFRRNLNILTFLCELMISVFVVFFSIWFIYRRSREWSMLVGRIKGMVYMFLKR